MVRSSLDDRQFKLYKLIWERFVACQMTPAEWDSTAVLIGADADGTDVVFRTTGRTLVFDGFYRAIGVPSVSDELTLPKLEQNQKLAPLQIDPTQHFSSPPPRYTEASLVKKLEAEGIGRPSTYASIVNVIQDRKYVEKIGGRFFATDMGMVVTDKLVEAFPHILDVGYTRKMESQLDAIEEKDLDWVGMLHEFYGPFKDELEKAHGSMQHAKAVMEPAPYTCPTCGAPTAYRFGKNGRFLSCTRYPDCKYAAPVDREGKPMVAQMTDITCPICGKGMTKRTGRFGAFLGCENYPTCKGIVNLDPKKGFVKLPKAPPLLTDVACPKCQAPLNMRRSKRGPWLSCSKFPKCRGRLAWTSLEPQKQKTLEEQLVAHEKANPVPHIRTTSNRVLREDEQYVPQVQGGDAGEPEAALDDAA
jgi:DNA topoisomerase-1